MAPGESEASWTAFLLGIFLRGLEGEGLRLVVTDGSSGFPGTRKHDTAEKPFTARSSFHSSRSISPIMHLL
jgi:hypothetical protein